MVGRVLVTLWATVACGRVGFDESPTRDGATLADGTTLADAMSMDDAATCAPTAVTGFLHSCAVTGGAVGCWGYNFWGQLGDGTTMDRTTAVAVAGLDSGTANLSAGESHTCAVRADGSVWCWGRNAAGQVGDGTTMDRTTPVVVPGLANGAGVARVSAGAAHTCAARTDGSLWCWGLNLEGELGDGTTVGRTAPVVVSGMGSGVASVATGIDHTCAVKTDRSLWCWGYNSNGQLGDGTTTGRTAPVAVSDMGSAVASVAAGDARTCATRTDGSLWCWGNNFWGQLGDGTTTGRATPVGVSGMGSGVASLSAGYDHTCAVRADGSLWCWGRNAAGQLGDGTTTDRSTAAVVSGMATGVASVAAGEYHTCAVRVDGSLWCWGDNRSGQLGIGSLTNSLTPQLVSPACP